MIQKTLLLFGDEARTTSLLYLYDKEGQSVFSPLGFDAFSSLHPWEIFGLMHFRVYIRVYIRGRFFTSNVELRC